MERKTFTIELTEQQTKDANKHLAKDYRVIFKGVTSVYEIKVRGGIIKARKQIAKNLKRG